MPPLSQPQVVGWLLLFIPGFVSLSMMSWLGWPATRRSQLHWLAYSLIVSLICEFLVRATVDRLRPGWADSVGHPLHRAAALLVVGGIIGVVGGLFQYSPRVNDAIWRLLKEAGVATGWLGYFRNPESKECVRIETTRGAVMVAHVESFTIDPGDPNQELILTDCEMRTAEGWEPIPGRTFLNAREVAFVVSGPSSDALKEIGVRPSSVGFLTAAMRAARLSKPSAE